jgi:hypothetical protein
MHDFDVKRVCKHEVLMLVEQLEKATCKKHLKEIESDLQDAIFGYICSIEAGFEG